MSRCAVHVCRAASQLSGTAVAGTLAAGDAAFAEAEVHAREATNALMELSARLPDRWDQLPIIVWDGLLDAGM